MKTFYTVAMLERLFPSPRGKGGNSSAFLGDSQPLGLIQRGASFSLPPGKSAGVKGNEA